MVSVEMNVMEYGILYSFRLRTILVAALYYIRYASVHRRGRPVCLPRYMPHDTFGHPLVGAQMFDSTHIRATTRDCPTENGERWQKDQGM